MEGKLYVTLEVAKVKVAYKKAKNLKNTAIG